MINMDNWLSRLLMEKLQSKCTKDEIDQLASDIFEKRKQESVISFVRKKDYVVFGYDVRDFYAIEELKKGKSFSFVIKGHKFEDCSLVDKTIDLFALVNKYCNEFTQVDSRTLVKLLKVNRYNSDNGHLFFDDPMEGKAPIVMQVNMSAMALIKRDVGIEKDICAPKSSAYAYRGGWKMQKEST